MYDKKYISSTIRKAAPMRSCFPHNFVVVDKSYPNQRPCN